MDPSCRAPSLIPISYSSRYAPFSGGTILLGPTIQEDFDMSTDELQWLGTSFYIPLVESSAFRLLTLLC